MPDGLRAGRHTTNPAPHRDPFDSQSAGAQRTSGRPARGQELPAGAVSGRTSAGSAQALAPGYRPYAVFHNFRQRVPAAARHRQRPCCLSLHDSPASARQEAPYAVLRGRRTFPCPCTCVDFSTDAAACLLGSTPVHFVISFSIPVRRRGATATACTQGGMCFTARRDQPAPIPVGRNFDLSHLRRRAVSRAGLSPPGVPLA